MKLKAIKTIRVGLCVFLLLFACIGAGCTQAKDLDKSTPASASDPIVGTWKLVGATIDGSRMTVDEYQAVTGNLKVTVMEFFDDGVAYIDNLGRGSGVVEWKAVEDGSTYILTDETGGILEIKFVNGQLDLTVETVSLFLEKT
ncbi:MAG: lipocalin family protein [Eggerthellaceae bacterium]|jgi:hypothetical protein|nr:lipocalin family protein [Eggerthellaceae bacterium]MDR2721526.1 lipocalin family protein [Coriobacteriaceae bacterium]